MKRRPGLTLIEAVISLVILAIAIIPTVNFWLASAQANAATAMRQRALILAEQVMETRVRAVPFSMQTAVSGQDPTSGMTYSLILVNQTTTLRKATVQVTPQGEASPLVTLVTLTRTENAP